jgi:ACT domain-containing protein
MMREKVHAVVTVTGRDRVGIVAAVSKILADYNVNIIDISQTILQEDIFAMMVMVDIAKASVDLLVLEDALKTTGESLGVKIMIQHEDIFRYMHRI